MKRVTNFVEQWPPVRYSKTFKCPEQFNTRRKLNSCKMKWDGRGWQIPDHTTLEAIFSSVQFGRSVVSDSLRPHELQHGRLPSPSPTPRAYSNSCPLGRWCHPTISSSVIPFSCLQSFPASGFFLVSQFFASGGQSIGVSALTLVLPMNIQDWPPLGWTGWISLPYYIPTIHPETDKTIKQDQHSRIRDLKLWFQGSDWGRTQKEKGRRQLGDSMVGCWMEIVVVWLKRRDRLGRYLGVKISIARCLIGFAGG